MAEPKATRDQERAQGAFEAVEAMKDNPGKADYARMAIRLPGLIHAAGLCQALAFLQAKAKAKKGGVARLLEDFERVSNVRAAATRTAATGEYLRLAREGMRCAEWFKRYSEAFLDGGE
jgi:CRISPR-associated protein Cmr5